MYHLRRVFAFLAAVGFVLGMVGHGQAQVAAATSVTLSKTGVTHSRANRGNNLLNTQINYDDCHLGDEINFTVSLSSNFSSYSLQLWAGSGCDDKATRLSTSVLSCWQLGVSGGTGIVPMSINPDPIPISVREILFGKTLASGTSSGVAAGTSGSGGGGDTSTGGDTSAGSGGTATSSAGATATSGDASCIDKNAVSAAQNISVYIMLIDGNNVVAGTFATWNATYKLLAPPPPDNVSAGIGETLLPISFSYDSTTVDSTINGYTLYCDPPPGAAAAIDAGVYPDDGGDLLVPACKGSTNLIQGQRPDGLFKCGTAGKAAKKGNATGLINGVAYNVAISTTDSYGNSGVLSKVVCEVPQPVTGFFEAYRDAGGEGGGGFCSFSRRREPLPLIALLGFTAYWVMRRRRAT
jgi:hypothetical protein